MLNTDKPSKKKAISVTVNEALLEEARNFGLNISQAAEDGLRQEIRKKQEEEWKEQAAPAVKAYNEWIYKNGLPINAHWMQDDEHLEDV